MESFTNYVYDAVDRVAKRVEEGYEILTGALEEEQERLNQQQQQQQSFGTDGEGDFSIGDNEDIPSFDDLGDESPLSGMARGVLDDILSKQVGPRNAMEQIQAFCSAVNWKEPFVMGLVGLQIMLLILVVVSIKTNTLVGRMLLFFILVGTSKVAELVNDYLSTHFEEYGITQNYFDSSGLFMAVVVCVPAMLMAVALLLSLIWESKHLLIEVKRMELKKKKQQQKKQKKQTKKSTTTSTQQNDKTAKTD